MSGVTDLVRNFDPPIKMSNKSDELDIAYANGDDATYGVEVIYTPLG